MLDETRFQQFTQFICYEVIRNFVRNSTVEIQKFPRKYSQSRLCKYKEKDAYPGPF